MSIEDNLGFIIVISIFSLIYGITSFVIDIFQQAIPFQEKLLFSIVLTGALLTFGWLLYTAECESL